MVYISIDDNIKTIQYVNIIKCVSQMNSQGTMTWGIDEEGMTIQCIDSNNTGFFDCTIPSTWFTTFKISDVSDFVCLVRVADLHQIKQLSSLKNNDSKIDIEIIQNRCHFRIKSKQSGFSICVEFNIQIGNDQNILASCVDHDINRFHIDQNNLHDIMNHICNTYDIYTFSYDTDKSENTFTLSIQNMKENCRTILTSNVFPHENTDIIIHPDHSIKIYGYALTYLRTFSQSLSNEYYDNYTLCIKQNIPLYLSSVLYPKTKKDDSQCIQFAFYLSPVQITHDYEKYGLHHIDDMNDVICDMIIKN